MLDMGNLQKVAKKDLQNLDDSTSEGQMGTSREFYARAGENFEENTIPNKLYKNPNCSTETFDENFEYEILPMWRRKYCRKDTV